MLPPPPRTTLLPYTTLFRSERGARALAQQLTRTGRLLTSELDPAAVLDEVVQQAPALVNAEAGAFRLDRKSTRLNSSHLGISYAVFCLKKQTKRQFQQVGDT